VYNIEYHDFDFRYIRGSHNLRIDGPYRYGRKHRRKHGYYAEIQDDIIRFAIIHATNWRHLESAIKPTVWEITERIKTKGIENQNNGNGKFSAFIGSRDINRQIVSDFVTEVVHQDNLVCE
jgi:hypothetical protein